MFEGFATQNLRVGDAEIHLRTAGKGAPLLLLHGYPQTHVCWHKVAPALAEDFSLVVADLRGYGESKGPTPDLEHWNYSKRAMAEDMRAVMAALGSIVGSQLMKTKVSSVQLKKIIGVLLWIIAVKMIFDLFK